MRGKILTGTASWTDPGFVAAWYPEDLPASARLQWYADHFPLVEVNSTFYRVPEPGVTRKWRDQTPPRFVFDLKLHRLLSRHSTPLNLLPSNLRSMAETRGPKAVLTPALEKAMAKEFIKGIRPLRESGKLGALLLQLSPAFSPRHNSLEELDHLVECFRGFTLSIELRNGGWLAPERATDTRRFFTTRTVPFVMVDAPADPHFTILPSVDWVTSARLAYLRAHGRNTSGYIRKRTVAERFDYVYSDQELREIAARATAAAEKAKEVHVIYNNNKADYAPRAAAAFQNIIAGKSPHNQPAAKRQKQLAL